MYDLAADVTRHTARLANLQKRYAKIAAMQVSDPDRFRRSRFGVKYQLKDERYNECLRHLRLLMAPLWPINESHRIYKEDRLATLIEHVLREREFYAALTTIFPGREDYRGAWEKLDRAHTQVRAALAIARGEDEPLPDIDMTIEDIEVVAA